MVEHHASKEEIVKAVKYLRSYISSAFIIDSTHRMCQSGQISKRIQVLCDSLFLHPVIVFAEKQDGGQRHGDG